MGQTPWTKYQKAEVVKEGGPWSKYGNMSPREAVDALPDFLTRTADEKSEDRRNAANQAFIESLPTSNNGLTGKAGTFSGQYLNSSTLGNIDNLNAAFDELTGINSFTGQTFAQSKDQHRDTRQVLREANPVSGMIGDIAGYLAPGTAGWKALSAAGRSIPGATTLANSISQTGRVPAWLQRMGGSIGLFTADAALYGATVGASNEEAAAGRDLTLGERTQSGVDYAKANLGEMADGIGIDIPEWARGVPVSIVFPMAGSITERTVKGISTGGRSITPDRVQAEVLNSIGRAPTQSAARGMAEVIDTGPVNSSTIKTFRFIENALRDAGKSAGLSETVIRDRISRGFRNIRDLLPSSADGRTPLAVVIEREFAEELGPVVSENLRKFLLKVGLDDPGVTRGFIDDLRQTQVDDFRKLVDENLGEQSAIDFEKTVAQGIEKKAQSRQQVINKAREVANDGAIAQSLREQLIDNDFKGLLEGARSNRGWKDVDTFIQKDPWNAANILQQELGRLEGRAFNSGNVAQYTKLKETKEWIQDFLGRSDSTGLPGYNRLTGQIAAETRVRENLGYTDGFGKKHAGFGPDLKTAARSERDTQRMVERYAGETPQDIAAVARLPNKASKETAFQRAQAAARISTGEVLKDQLRGARPGGVNAQGQDIVGLRLADLQTVGMMDSLRNVFADAGDNIADGVNHLVSRRQFLADIDPKTGSNTQNKQNAFATGDDAFTRGLGRSINTDALADVLMFANGLPPVVSMLRSAPGWVKAPFRLNRTQRAEIARALLNMPPAQSQPQNAFADVTPLTGHSNPRWQNDKRWEDPVLTGVKNAFATNEAGGALIGGSLPFDYDQDGEITTTDRIVSAAFGAGGVNVAKRLDNAFTSAPRHVVANGVSGPRDESRIARQMVKAVQKDKARKQAEQHLQTVGLNIQNQAPRQNAFEQINGTPSQNTSLSSRFRQGAKVVVPAAGLGAGAAALNFMSEAGDEPASTANSGRNQFLSSVLDTAQNALDAEQSRIEQGLPRTPGLKPNLASTMQAVDEMANRSARSEESQRRQEYYGWLKRTPGAGNIWTRVHEERADDLRVTPEDRARGVVAKRLQYGYEVPIEALETAPVEELIAGEWIPVQ